MDNVLKY